MDLLMEVFTALAPTTVPIVAVIVFWQRFPSKKYMQMRSIVSRQS